MSPKVQKLRHDAKVLCAAKKAIILAAIEANRVTSDEENAKIAKMDIERNSLDNMANTLEIAEGELTEYDKPLVRGGDGRPIIDVEEVARGNPVARTKGWGPRTRYCNDAKEAYRFGMYLIGAAIKSLPSSSFKLSGSRTAERATEMFREINALQIEGSDIPGGVLVPPEFAWTVINLVETFGTIRRNCDVRVMTRDNMMFPRETLGLTAYLVGEAQKITASTKSWDQIRLNSKKVGVIGTMSAELSEDSAINIGDSLMGSIARAMALSEDQAGWNGDGTNGQATEYLGIIGARYKLKNLSATISKIPGLSVGSGSGHTTDYSGLVIGDFTKTIGNLPQYADTPSAKWYCHRTFYWQVMQTLAVTAGGVTMHEVINGVRSPMFLGYPVEYCQVFDRTAAASQVCTMFGDLSQALTLGDRKDLEFAISADATIVDGATTYNSFQMDMLAVRGIRRFDINAHDLGRNTDDYTATAERPGQGPLVGLITAAS